MFSENIASLVNGNLFKKYATRYQFKKIGEKTIICLLKCNNSFEIVGTSSPLNIEMLDNKIGEHYALKDAFK